jgi:outer membrane receptor protein involved in Fe transport
VDGSISYDTGSSLSMQALNDVKFSINVQNVFDTDPPFVAEFSQNFDSSIASALGRVVTFNISKKF